MGAAKTIYLVEDDESIRELVVYTLNTSGYAAEGFVDAGAFNRAMQHRKPALVLLDIMLPGEDGIAILRRIRAVPETAGLPVIMLTAKSAEYDKVLGLDSGADDYVTKPFGMMELLSRVRAVLRRSAPENEQASEPLSVAGIEMDTGRHAVRVGGQEVLLTLKEFELLRLLMENPALVFSREQLLERIWGYSFDGETRTVDVHVRSLRRKLNTGGEAIETVRGVGYRLGGQGSGE